jgi:hypothetical protein
VDWVVVYHPKSIGQVECANGLILQGIKTHIYKRAQDSCRTIGGRTPFPALEPANERELLKGVHPFF